MWNHLLGFVRRWSSTFGGHLAACTSFRDISSVANSRVAAIQSFVQFGPPPHYLSHPQIVDSIHQNNQRQNVQAQLLCPSVRPPSTWKGHLEKFSGGAGTTTTKKERTGFHSLFLDTSYIKTCPSRCFFSLSCQTVRNLSWSNGSLGRGQIWIC